MQRSLEHWIATKMISVVGGFLLLVIVSGLADAQQPAKSAAANAGKAEETHDGQPVSFWMRKKLDFSKGMLGGIAAADFDEIAKNAQTMRGLSKIESFVRRGTPGYRTQVDIFEQSLDEIIRQANKENLEGVTLAFNQLTVSCVNCHKQLREKK